MEPRTTRPDASAAPLRVVTGHLAWVRHGRATALHAAAVVALLSSIVVALFMFHDDASWIPLVMVACWFVGAVFGVAADRARTPRWVGGSLSVETDHLRAVVDGRSFTIPRAHLHVVRWRCAPAEGVWHLELRSPSGDTLCMQLASPEGGDALLRAVSLDAPVGRSRHEFQSVAHQALWVFVAWPIAAFVMAGGIGVLCGWLRQVAPEDLTASFAQVGWRVGLLALGALVLRGCAPGSVVVGADGVTLVRWRREFIPYATMGRVSVLGGALLVEHRGGQRCCVDSAPPHEHAPTQTADTIEHRRRAFRVHDRAVPEVLARAGRTATQWRDDLTALSTERGAYRGPKVDTETLLELVEAPGALPMARLGAALAVAPRGDECRARVRWAAASCANEPLREALDAVLDGRLDDRHVQQIERATSFRAACGSSVRRRRDRRSDRL